LSFIKEKKIASTQFGEPRTSINMTYISLQIKNETFKIQILSLTFSI